MSLVFDFDCTLVDGNTDEVVPQVVAPNLLTFIKEEYGKGRGWNDLMGEVGRVMHSRGIPRSAIEAALCTMTISADFKKGIELAKSRGLRALIVSDANEVYINTIVKHEKLDTLIDAVHTNPAYFEEELLVIRPHVPKDSPHGCAKCPVNMCKGRVMDALALSSPVPSAAAPATPVDTPSSVATPSPAPTPTGALGAAGDGGGAMPSPATAASAPRRPVLYVGDGGGDLCPVLRLGEGDVVCARVGYALLGHLQSDDIRPLVKATVVPWASPADVLAAIETFVATNVSMAAHATPSP